MLTNAQMERSASTMDHAKMSLVDTGVAVTWSTLESTVSRVTFPVPQVRVVTVECVVRLKDTSTYVSVQLVLPVQTVNGTSMTVWETLALIMAPALMAFFSLPVCVHLSGQVDVVRMMWTSVCRVLVVMEERVLTEWVAIYASV